MAQEYIPLSDTLVNVGKYSKTSARHYANKIMTSEAMQEAIKSEGISLEGADKVVKSILNAPVVYEMVTPDNQLRAADYISKRLAGYAPERLEVKQVIAKITFNKPK